MAGYSGGDGCGRAGTMTGSAGYVPDIGFRLPDFELAARFRNKSKKCREET